MLKNIKYSFMYDVYVKRNIFILQLLISSKLHYKIINTQLLYTRLLILSKLYKV